MSARSANRLHILLLAGYFAVAALLWPILPDRIPTHFGWNGEVTTWSRTSWLSWFGLPLVAACMALFFQGCMRLARRTPELWNIPEKQRFLRLSPEARAPIAERLERIGALSAILTTVVLMSIHFGVLQAALGRTAGLPWYSQLTAVTSLVLLLALAIREARRAGEEIRMLSGD